MGIFFCDDGVHVTDGTGVSNYPTTLIFYKKLKILLISFFEGLES